MRRSTAPAVLLVLTLVGCGADAPTAPIPDAPALNRAAAAHPAAPARSMKGSCEAQSAEPPVLIFPILHQVATGTCQLAHLGRASLRTVARLNILTGVQMAEITYTAANGDLLYATSIGTGTPTGPTTIEFSGTTTIIGGTGRFTNATGVMAAAGTSNTATGITFISYDGWITYDAADRRNR